MFSTGDHTRLCEQSNEILSTPGGDELTFTLTGCMFLNKKTNKTKLKSKDLGSDQSSVHF